MITSCTTESYFKHLLKPFCPFHTSQARVSKIFYCALGLTIAGLAVYRLLSQRSVSIGETSPKKTQMAEIFESEGQIKALTEINGVKIEIIEGRAEPHRSESPRGFLPSFLKLKSSLSRSWEEARKFGVTHIEMADILDKICEPYKDKPSGFQTTVTLDLKALCPKLLGDNPQNLQITVSRCPEKNIRDTDIFRPYRTESTYNSYFEIEIENPSSGSKIIWTPVRGSFIRKYGFYSLGIDFIDRMSVLTGKTKEKLILEVYHGQK